MDEVTSQAVMDGILIDKDKVKSMPEKIILALLDKMYIEVYLSNMQVFYSR